MNTLNQGHSLAVRALAILVAMMPRAALAQLPQFRLNADIEVQCCEALGAWTTLRTISAPQKLEDFEDDRPVTGPRFYRIRVLR